MSIVCGGDRCLTKKELQNALVSGKKIHPAEFAEAKRHRLYPGPGCVLQKKKFFRNRLKEQTVSEFIEWLYAGDMLQGLSYGQKIIQYCNGVHVPIESLKRKRKVHNIIQLYAENWVHKGLATNRYRAETSVKNGV